MIKPEIIERPGGERMALLPLAEYERLKQAAEDLEDIAAYDEAHRRLAAGEDEMIPAEFAERLLADENPVRVWREIRKLSARELAGMAGISPAYLSQIERGTRDGTVEILKNIAVALNVSIDDLVQ